MLLTLHNLIVGESGKVIDDRMFADRGLDFNERILSWWLSFLAVFFFLILLLLLSSHFSVLIL